MNQTTGVKYIPHVIEPSFGVDRTVLAVLCESYREDEKRTWLSLPFSLAPYKIAVFPLLANKPELVEKAKIIYNKLRQKYPTAWDDRGNIGKRYFSQDEIGTPLCITIDFETLENDTVTVRQRDSMAQERIAITDILKKIEEQSENQSY
jgi:glycyl-tRNA synthetase